MNTLRILPTSIVLICLATATARGQEPVTTWTNSEGKSIEAEFVSLTEDGVILKLKANGKQAEVAFSSLSLESHLQAIKLGKPEEFSKPLVKAVVEPAIEIPPPKTYDVDALLQSPFSETQTLEEFIELAQTELRSGNYFVLWHMLPEQMQADLTKLGAQGMQQVGSAPIVQIKTLLKHLNTIVSEKEEFVFGYPDVARSKADKRAMATQWPVLKQFVQALSDESLWEQENFQEENFERWLAHLMGALGSNHEAVLALADHQTGGMASGAFSRMATVTASTPDAGQVEFTLPLPIPMEPVTFRKFEDVWVAPAFIKPMREAVDNGLAEIDTLDDAKIKQALQASLGTIIPIFSAMARAETQEEFNAVVDQLKPLIEQAAQQAPPLNAPMPGGSPQGSQGNRNLQAPGAGGTGSGGANSDAGQTGGSRKFQAPGFGGSEIPNG